MNEKPTHLDLFSGIGGFALAAQWAGFRTIGFCEIDKYCQKVLAKNFMAYACGRTDEGIHERRGGEIGMGMEWDALSSSRRQQSPDRSCRMYSDIRELDGRQFAGVSLITGGFPCQPFSVAGKRRGAADDRHLWPEMLRVIKEARPAWVLGENVPGIIPMELDNLLSDLESIGYATRPFVIPACAVDARHRRDRLWIIAKSYSERRCLWSTNGSDASNAWESPCTWKDEQQWFAESGMGRISHGIRNRVDRLKGLGNAIVPQVAYEILLEIRKLI